MIKKLTIFAGLLFGIKGYIFDCTGLSTCEVDGNASTIVIADKSISSVVVNCVNPNQCKKDGSYAGLIVYSSANNTYINCFGDDSCEETQINLGVTPHRGLSTDFEVSRSKVIVKCTGKQSCKGIDIVNVGTVTNGLDIITPVDASINKGAFMNGLTECGTQTQCTLQCGTVKDTCKDSKCYDNCVCQGSACSADVNQRPTPKPTPPPTNTTQNNNNVVPTPIGTPTMAPFPTPEPTPSPTDARNITECTTNGCVLEPEANYDVICPIGITECIIRCTGEGQCKESVIVVADSDIVNIICSGKGACSTIQIFNTQPSEINIIVNGETGAQSALVQIDNEKSNLTITVSTQEGFGYGTLICDGDCDLKCLAKDACKDVTYECLTPSDKCTLTCNSVTDVCPTILNFGDASCSTPICAIEADGDSRIIALNNVNKLTVICNSAAGQCKANGAGLKVYTAALETELLCDNMDSCENVAVYAGALIGSNVPKGFKASEFSRIDTLSLNANCSNNGGCKEISIYTTGNINTVINGDGEEALAGATSICDSCSSLKINCTDFDGCINSNILCTDPLVCTCNNAFEVDIGNDTAVLPRESCPAISPYIPRQKNIVNSNTNTILNNSTQNKMKIILPIIIIGVLLLFSIPFVIRKYNKSYTSINGGTTNASNVKYMLDNQNVYGGFQVEME